MLDFLLNPPASEPVAENPPSIAARKSIGVAVENQSKKLLMGRRAVAIISVFFLPQTSVIVPKKSPKSAVNMVAVAKMLPRKSGE